MKEHGDIRLVPNLIALIVTGVGAMNTTEGEQQSLVVDPPLSQNGRSLSARGKRSLDE